MFTCRFPSDLGFRGAPPMSRNSSANTPGLEARQEMPGAILKHPLEMGESLHIMEVLMGKSGFNEKILYKRRFKWKVHL